jgi:hypothetical protein
MKLCGAPLSDLYIPLAVTDGQLRLGSGSGSRKTGISVSPNKTAECDCNSWRISQPYHRVQYIDAAYMDLDDLHYLAVSL